MSGLIHILEGDDPVIIFSETGSVLVTVNGETGLQFRTKEAYLDWQLKVDRSWLSASHADMYRRSEPLPGLAS